MSEAKEKQDYSIILFMKNYFIFTYLYVYVFSKRHVWKDIHKNFNGNHLCGMEFQIVSSSLSFSALIFKNTPVIFLFSCNQGEWDRASTRRKLNKLSLYLHQTVSPIQSIICHMGGH